MGEGSRVGMFGKMQSRSMMKLYQCQFSDFPRLSTEELMLLNCGVEKTLENSLDNKEIKLVNPKEINPEYSLEGLTLKLKLQYFGHLMQKANSLEKTVILGKTEGKRRRGQQRIR